MRALVFEGPGLIAVADRPDPAIVEATDALVRVTRAGLCGSDLHPYLGREPLARGAIPGHEAVGVVEAVGSATAGLEVGQRVIVPFTTSCGGCDPCSNGLSARCESGELFGWRNPKDPKIGLDGCQAELVRVPLAASTLVAAPDVSDPAALLLADNLPTAAAAVHRARARDSLTVVGLGAVGLCAIAVAKASGVGHIVAIDPVPARLEAAVGLGAVPGGPGVSEPTASVIEAAGSPAAQRTALECASPGAFISIISVQTSTELPFTPIEAYNRNLTVAWGRAPVRSILDHQLDFLAGVARSISDVVVDEPEWALGDGPIAYRAFSDRAFIKAAMDPAR